MPAPPINTAPRDTVEMALNLARTRLNDAIESLDGDILTDTQPFSQTIVNGAWRRYQGYLANKGFTSFKDVCVIFAIPVVGNPNPARTPDPATRCWINWSGFWDGSAFYPQPVLPQDLISPLKIWQRQNGSNQPFFDPPMELILDGIPDYPKSCFNRQWEWQNETIQFGGCTQVNDFKILYNKLLPDFFDMGDVPWMKNKIPIMRSLDTLASYICYETSMPRGDIDAAVFKAEAEAAADQIFNRDMRMKQRTNIRRRSHSGRLEGADQWHN